MEKKVLLIIGALVVAFLLFVSLVIGAIIVVGVMGWFPGISNGGTSGGVSVPQSRQYWAGMATPFAITDYEFSGSGVTIVMKDMVNDDLEVTWVQVGPGVLNVPLKEPTVDFVPGEQKNVEVTGLPACVPGETVSYPVMITYDNKETGLNGKQQVGEKPLVGTCV
jgi:hypothetical protein